MSLTSTLFRAGGYRNGTGGRVRQPEADRAVASLHPTGSSPLGSTGSVDFLLILIPLAAASLVVHAVNRLDRRPAVRRDPRRPRWTRGEIAKSGRRLVENLVIGIPTFLLVLWVTGKAWS